MSNFPTITWVTAGLAFTDYRPAIGPDGKTAVFERTTVGNTKDQIMLYVMDVFSTNLPQVFIESTGKSVAQTRPDWCWITNQVVFNNSTVWIVDGNGENLAELPLSHGYVYPQWWPKGNQLTMYNAKATATPNPCSTVVSNEGDVVNANINGNDQNGVAVYGGMPAVNPCNPILIAYAGQPLVENWNGPDTGLGYNQTNNYIFLNTDNNGTFSSSPMETGASIDQYDNNFQGRAPAWSPDGRYIVFESTRTDNQFALFLFDTQGNGTAPVQITDTSFRVQHAKFFPDGTKLILCGKPTTTAHNGIGWVDIAQYLAS